MSDQHTINNKRIAKNTLVLYLRMMFLMVISLYTSRVVLQALGVEDFGTYNVVGGFVILFSVLSKSLSSAASRFFNYAMGKGNKSQLDTIFSSTVFIHWFMAFIILIIAEIVGVWFVNNKMVIAPDRLHAANWVFQFSLLTFCFNLITVPYNAAIIAHEKMSAFAYISIIEGIGKLLICYLVMAVHADRLIFYAFLCSLVQIIVKAIYQWYCRKHFEECRVQFVYDKNILKDILSFAGWNMIGSSSAVLRNQGGDILINLFGGPVVNAARAVANQVLHTVHSFVDNFFTALKPQITKSYASGDFDYMMALIYQGCRLSYYMLLVLCLPVLASTDFLLHLWLKNVPDHSVQFVQLTLVFTMIESISTPLITAQQATGKIRNYQLVVGGLQLMNLPVSYILLKAGGVPETILYVAIFFAICCLCARLYMLRNNIRLKVLHFIKNVLLNLFIVSICAAVIPFALTHSLQDNLSSFFLITIVCVICSAFSILYIGCKKAERQFVYGKALQIKRRFCKW